MKSTDVTIIAAPFGYGPTGKSLAIAKELMSRGYSVKLLGDVNTLKISKSAGVLAYEYEYRTELDLANTRSKLVISYLDISTKIINSSDTPLIFGDSLFFIRGWFERSYNYPADAVISQRFFRPPLEQEIYRANHFYEVGAILPRAYEQDLPKKEARLIFYPGGLRSPYLGDKYGKKYFDWCTKVIFSAAKKVGWQPNQIHFLVPPQLGDTIENLKNAGIHAYTSIPDTATLMLKSSHAIISPGIETTLEALAAGINPLFTPAFNGSHVPQLIANREAGIGQEFSQTFSRGLQKFEGGTNNLSALSQKVEEYTLAALSDNNIFLEAVDSTTKYLSQDQQTSERFPLGKNGAKEFADIAEQYLRRENVPNAFYRVAAKAKICSGNKVALVKESKKGWDFPGGGIEHGETIFEGLQRELTEEAGITDFVIKSGPLVLKTIDIEANRPLLFLFFEIEAKNIKEGIFKDGTLKLFDKNSLPEDLVAFSQEYTDFLKKQIAS